MAVHLMDLERCVGGRGEGMTEMLDRGLAQMQTRFDELLGRSLCSRVEHGPTSTEEQTAAGATMGPSVGAVAPVEARVEASAVARNVVRPLREVGTCRISGRARRPPSKRRCARCRKS